ncbi:MAG TPA: DUF1344 domain-containing protein [Rhizomicrobium sp.]|nr:DUF1344 domain-containing protein [Rhizomicrobium sp.]
MKKLIVPVFGLALIAGPAWAWSEVTGSITSVDPGKHQIVLDNGKTYSLQADVKMSNLAAGDKVTLNSETKGKRNLVNRVTKTG